MKILRPIGAIVCWAIAYTVIAFLGSKGIQILRSVINTETTFGFILLLAIALPVIAGINFYICLAISVYLLETKTQALITLLVCGLWVILLFFYSPTNIINWALTASTIFAFLIVYLGKLGESKKNG